jgi:hypothetical protein
MWFTDSNIPETDAEKGENIGDLVRSHRLGLQIDKEKEEERKREREEAEIQRKRELQEEQIQGEIEKNQRIALRKEKIRTLIILSVGCSVSTTIVCVLYLLLN